MNPIVGRVRVETRGEELAAGFDGGRATATDGNSTAMDCLRAAVQASGLPQKQLAGRRSLPQFNKLLNGVQAFPIAVLDELPADVRDDFLCRYGEQCGLVVRRPTSEEDLARQADLLLKATALVQELTAAHIRTQMRGRR